MRGEVAGKGKGWTRRRTGGGKDSRGGCNKQAAGGLWEVVAKVLTSQTGRSCRTQMIAIQSEME